MEEKERYELFGEFGIIHDTSPNAKCMLLNKFQTCEILNKQDKENQQLKQQLVDLQSEQIKEMQEHQEAMKLADKTIKDLEIKLLLKPSFGKFKSADELYKSYTNLGKEYTKSRQQLAEKEIEYQESMKILAVKNQNLTAIEQLEKVKNFFLEEHRDEEMDTDYIITKDAGEIADYLLDQIKQLKEGK